MEKFFKLKENNTTVKTEIAAGVTTFMTMAYILAVNPSILGDAGMDTTAVLLATALASFIGTTIMALYANLPFALSAGMGLNAYLAYTVVLGQGISWQTALFAVFIEGLIFILLSATNVREAIFNCIPLSLKTAISVGIGLFIAFIALQGSHIIIDNPATMVGFQNFTSSNINNHGICAILALIGTIVTGTMMYKKVTGAILIGIFVTWGLGIIAQFVGLYVVSPELGCYSLIPSLSFSTFTAAWESFSSYSAQP